MTRKIAFDTNVLITLCENSALATKFADIYRASSGDTYILVSTVGEEFDEPDPDKDSEEWGNWQKVKGCFERDDTRFFTIGVSLIDGNDILAPDTGFQEIKKKAVYDAEKYEEYVERRKREGQEVLSHLRWYNRNSKQGDAAIFAHAERLGCELLVTNNTQDFREVIGKYNCKIIKLEEFLAAPA